jgi:hypothetical protein
MLCETCCNIQYFDIHLDEDHLNPSEFLEEYVTYGFSPRIEALCTLRQLRVIHLRPL